MRIVSLAPAVTELLFALGLNEELVGVTKYCDTPAAELKPKMGGWMDIDFERVLAQKPDMVFTQTIVQQKVREQALSLGLNVIHTDPRSLSQVLESFKFIGNIVGRKKESLELAEKMKSDLGGLQTTHHKQPDKVYVEEWPSTVSGNWVPDLLECIGSVGLGKSDELSKKVSLAEVKSFDPDLIVLSWCGFGTRVSLDKITKRAGWECLRAVKEKRVFVIDDSLLNRPGPRLVDGARVLVQLVESTRG